MYTLLRNILLVVALLLVALVLVREAQQGSGPEIPSAAIPGGPDSARGSDSNRDLPPRVLHVNPETDDRGGVSPVAPLDSNAYPGPGLSSRPISPVPRPVNFPAATASESPAAASAAEESGGEFQLPPVAGSQEYPMQDAVPPFSGETDDAGDDAQASLLPLENQSPPASTRRITTGPNDSFWTISEAVYGSKAYYRALFRHNRQAVLRPDQLKAGIELEVPPLETLRSLYPEEFPVDSRGG